MTPRDQCASHIEFTRRIDDRWKDHREEHESYKDDICAKFESLFKGQNELIKKTNWILGVLFALGPLLLMFVTILISHIQGVPK